MSASLEFARHYREAGISVLPIRTDKSKAPAVPKWSHLQERLATTEELEVLFRLDLGLAAIGGKVSGNLEVYDIDESRYFEPWKELVINHLGNEFFLKLPIVRTPRPGFHVYTRCELISGNQKLAMKLIPDSAHPQGKTVKTIIETRAEGGYVLLPGCPPACHESGRTYDLMQGSLDSIPAITTQEREILMSCARSFNEVVREETRHTTQANVAADSPGADFAAKTNWDEILRPHGYRFAGHHGDVTLWTRPGKEHGISASTNYAGSDLFYPFSTNCYPFESERGYNKFSVYTLLTHGGDFHASAKVLAAQGFGNPHRQVTVRGEQQEPSESLTIAALSDIVEPMSLKERMRELYRTGLRPGESPGWDSVRRFWTIRKTELTIITGAPGHGKSAWTNAVMVNLAKRQGWKWGVYSAENIPHEVHIADLMEQYVGKPYNEGYRPRITPEEHDKALGFIHDHFRFISPPEDEDTVDRLVADCMKLKNDFGVDGILMDPWNEITHTWASSKASETEYISKSLKRIKRFAQHNDVHVIVIAHPMKLQKDKDGKYPIPTPYDISGGANWRNKADCVLCVWRDEANPGSTKIFIQKVRRKFVGRIGSVELKYDIVNGRFSEYEINRSRQPGDDD